MNFQPQSMNYELHHLYENVLPNHFNEYMINSIMKYRSPHPTTTILKDLIVEWKEFNDEMIEDWKEFKGTEDEYKPINFVLYLSFKLILKPTGEESIVSNWLLSILKTL